MTEYIKDYGYYTPNQEEDKTFRITKGQVISGYTLGIMLLDVHYPLIPGNVVNASTYAYPVRLKQVRGATTTRLFKNDRTLLEDFVAAAKELELEGVRAISGACGYFANFQKELSEAVNIPVFMSALLQIPLIKMGLQADQKIGVICATKQGLTEKTLRAVGVEDMASLAIAGLENTEEFGGLVNCTKHELNNSKVRNEVVSTAIQLVEKNNIGAILLECSDLPPYAADIQRAVNLPVFDFISLHNWIHHAVLQKPYPGWI
jgi:Asp/Glu/hydantoin racemase